jgi:hypothetical protein
MNIKNITPKEIWAPGGSQIADMLSLSNFYDYHFDGGSGKVTYNLIGKKLDGDGSQSLKVLFTGFVEVPADYIAQWGESDQIIWDYVAQNLNLSLI